MSVWLYKSSHLHMIVYKEGTGMWNGPNEIIFLNFFLKHEAIICKKLYQDS